MAQNITYLFGAGASALAIPVVEKLSQAMFKMSEDIKSKLKNSEINVSHRAELYSFAQNLFWLYKESSDHYTIDTYAKKLFIQKKYDELNKLKITLSLFFNIYQNITLDNGSRANIDKRYISFFAGLLQFNNAYEADIPEGINFLSWNYDAQFELAFQDFFQPSKLDSIQSRIRTFPSKRRSYNANGDERLIHLNGIAGFYERSRTEITHNFALGDLNLSYNKLIENTVDLINNLHKKQYYLDKLFYFAWEKDEYYPQEGIKKAIKIMSKTDIVVVIGYSFPFFNRSIDKKLFEVLKSNSKVYYQDLKPDSNFLINTYDVKNVKSIENCNQFFLPPELDLNR